MRNVRKKLALWGAIGLVLSLAPTAPARAATVIHASWANAYIETNCSRTAGGVACRHEVNSERRGYPATAPHSFCREGVFRASVAIDPPPSARLDVGCSAMAPATQPVRTAGGGQDPACQTSSEGQARADRIISYSSASLGMRFDIPVTATYSSGVSTFEGSVTDSSGAWTATLVALGSSTSSTGLCSDGVRGLFSGSVTISGPLGAG